MIKTASTIFLFFAWLQRAMGYIIWAIWLFYRDLYRISNLFCLLSEGWFFVGDFIKSKHLNAVFDIILGIKHRFAIWFNWDWNCGCLHFCHRQCPVLWFFFLRIDKTKYLKAYKKFMILPIRGELVDKVSIGALPTVNVNVQYYGIIGRI